MPWLALVPGCARPEGATLVVATPWPSGERAAIEADYRKAAPEARPIAWVPLMPGDAPGRLVPGLGVDLVVGIPAADLDRLATLEELAPVAEGGPREWLVARRSSIGTAVPSEVDAGSPPRLGLDDPRRDPLTLAWLKARLGPGAWGTAYGALVREAARPGRAVEAPAEGVEGAIDDRTSFVPLPGAHSWVEGVAIVADALRPDDARALLKVLANRGQSRPVSPDLPPIDPAGLVADGLLADLIGATLVDAREELCQAADALERAGHPEPYEAYLGDPPPWPPTSVARLRRADDAGAMVETLAREVAPGLESRNWLLLSWDRPERPVDGPLIRELAAADGGRLAAEPRFRAWLRGEWTAWARQHYRRIAREASRGAAGP